MVKGGLLLVRKRKREREGVIGWVLLFLLFKGNVVCVVVV
jgi:hypothetical protein